METSIRHFLPISGKDIILIYYITLYYVTIRCVFIRIWYRQNYNHEHAADFDNDAVDIRLWKMDQSTYEIVDGTSETSLAGNTVGGTGNIMKYIDTGGQYANVQMVTCAKFDLEKLSLFNRSSKASEQFI